MAHKTRLTLWQTTNMKRPSMKLQKRRVSKRQQRAINKLPTDKRSYIKRRVLFGDTLRQAKKKSKSLNM